ncbi:MAG: PQQ-binding-like beta-propeller repeat protein [Pirellulaceae bacterium]|nr:PQQ-binding-like beta-propeller repeat protein [Pirellulaceae bacterium]
MTLRRIACLFFVATIGDTVRGADWPQWMGPGRDDRWNETGIIEAIPAGGLPVRWRTAIAGGYAGPAIVGGRVFVTDYVRQSGEAKNDPGARAELSGVERVLCLDLATGKQIWKHEYPRSYKISYPAGPRATPTVADGKVYALGAEGNLLCLDAQLGKVLWQKDLQREYKTEAPIWGFAAHPLVDGNQLICLAGGAGSAVVSLNKDTGQEIWRALSSAEIGYCPPSIIEAGGKRQLLVWLPQNLHSLNPATGEVYWSQPLMPDYGMSICAPQKEGDYLFASGIGSVGALFKLQADRPGAELVWRGRPNDAVYCANSTPLIDNGVIYGADCQVGCLRAVRLADGKRLWETFAPTTGGERRASSGTAFLTKNGDRYFLFSETGDLVLARLSPEKYEELGRMHLLDPTGEAFGRPVVWSHPAFANRSIVVRNDKEIICVSLAKDGK